MQLFAPFFDRTFVGEFSQQTFEIGAERVFETECASNFAGADFARIVTDEGENVGL